MRWNERRNQKCKESNISSKILVYLWKNTESKNPKDAGAKKGRIMLLLKCALFESKKSKFVKEPEASGLLSSLWIKTPLSKIPLVGPVLI